MFTNLTSKQLGDVTETLVADHLTAAGCPAVKVRPNNPGFDLVALRDGERVSVEVKSHRATHDHPAFRFGSRGWAWLALVRIVHDEPRIWMLPREVAFRASSTLKSGRRRLTHERLVQDDLAMWEGNFTLRS
jgi:hypothetical protein